MPSAVRKGDTSSGHGSFGGHSATSGSPNVFINGQPAHRQGDSWETHQDNSVPPNEHGTVAGQGSATVFVNGKPKMRVGDKTECGSTIETGSSNVFTN